MSKRNLIQEIQQKNQRASGKHLHGLLELYAIEQSARLLGGGDRTQIALHVMGIAACIEVSVRETIKRLVDSGAPFLNRAEAFKDLRFDFALTRALSTQEITFGDLVSHSLPVSNLQQIASHVETLFDDGRHQHSFQQVIGELREFVEPDVLGSDEEGTAISTPPILVPAPDQLARDIGAIFEARHLVAHEATFDNVSLELLKAFLGSARLFVSVLYELVEQTLYPGRARFGFGQSIQHMEEAGKYRMASEVIAQRIRNRLTNWKGEDRDLPAKFERAEKLFEAYRDQEEHLRLAANRPFTGNAMRNIEASINLRLYKQRVECLEDLDETIELLTRAT